MASADDARKVLVVDDDADWREFLRLCLEELGYEAIEAANGQEALDSLARQRYGVMLLDLNMPGMNGLEVLERMPRGDPPRVVLLTAAAVQDVGGALRSGPHYYLPKGASRDQLSLLLQSLNV
ncbi:response regulator [Melittangium boletus]|uniref:Two-component system response regulator n=1 Tax=Melittangium boletus DSM 14713 TaxID=1294270 RepID=A0A250IL29_9BACT|nr:response regulator [Melittangium boletus]ATB32465.1 two-component system response regulator [Melittangium boletus DSM 14713]